MKNWNSPEISELNINETANGLFNSEYETLLFFNNNANPKPVTPDENVEKPEEKLS